MTYTRHGHRIPFSLRRPGEVPPPRVYCGTETSKYCRECGKEAMEHFGFKFANGEKAEALTEIMELHGFQFASSDEVETQEESVKLCNTTTKGTTATNWCTDHELVAWHIAPDGKSPICRVYNKAHGCSCCLTSPVDSKGADRIKRLEEIKKELDSEEESAKSLLTNSTYGEEVIEHRFGFHKATIEGKNATLPRHREIRLKFREFAKFLDDILPEGRAKARVMEDLESVSMWAHKAVAEEAPLISEG